MAGDPSAKQVQGLSGGFPFGSYPTDSLGNVLLQPGSSAWMQILQASTTTGGNVQLGPFSSSGARGALFLFGVTSLTGFTAVFFDVRIHDPASGNQPVIAQSPNRAAPLYDPLWLYPGIPAVANAQVPLPLPSQYYIELNLTGSGLCTYQVAACLLL